MTVQYDLHPSGREMPTNSGSRLANATITSLMIDKPLVTVYCMSPDDDGISI